MASLLSGDLLQSAAYYEQAIALFGELDERERLPSSLATLMLCGGHYQTETLVPAAVGFAESLKHGELALKIAGEIGQRSDEAYTLIHMAMCLGPRGEYARALEVAQRGLAIAEEIEHRQWMTAGHRALGALYLDLLALSEAQQHLEQALALAQEIGSWLWTRNSSGSLPRCILHNMMSRRRKLSSTPRPGLMIPPKRRAAARLVCACRTRPCPQRSGLLALHITDQLLASTANISEERSHPSPLRNCEGRRSPRFIGKQKPRRCCKPRKMLLMRKGYDRLLWRIAIDLGNLYQAQLRDEEAELAFATAQELIEDLADLHPRHVSARSVPTPGYCS